MQFSNHDDSALEMDATHRRDYEDWLDRVSAAAELSPVARCPVCRAPLVPRYPVSRAYRCLCEETPW